MACNTHALSYLKDVNVLYCMEQDVSKKTKTKLAQKLRDTNRDRFLRGGIRKISLVSSIL